MNSKNGNGEKVVDNTRKDKIQNYLNEEYDRQIKYANKVREAGLQGYPEIYKKEKLFLEKSLNKEFDVDIKKMKHSALRRFNENEATRQELGQLFYDSVLGGAFVMEWERALSDYRLFKNNSEALAYYENQTNQLLKRTTKEEMKTSSTFIALSWLSETNAVSLVFKSNYC